MLCLPVSLEGLLVLLAPCFTRPGFRTFRALVVGQVSQTGLRTVTGMLVGVRLSGVWHHSRAHRFFSQARWQPDQLGLRILDVIVQRLLAPDAPLVLAVDDTLLHRLGRKVHGTYWHHDATANSDQATVAWGNNWVCVEVNVTLDGPAHRARLLCISDRLMRVLGGHRPVSSVQSPTSRESLPARLRASDRKRQVHRHHPFDAPARFDQRLKRREEQKPAIAGRQGSCIVAAPARTELIEGRGRGADR